MSATRRPTRPADGDHIVEQAPPARLAFRLAPRTIRSLIPPNVIGTYLLLDGKRPIYVGRSDTCLRTRLATHNHQHAATHVLWQPARDAQAAYALEAYWFHQHSFTLNHIHPAAPTGTGRTCPFCFPSLHDALTHALPHIRKH